METDHFKYEYQLDKEEIQKIMDGLDLLDEYYSTHSEFDTVLNVRSLKSKLRNPEPTHILNQEDIWKLKKGGVCSY